VNEEIRYKLLKVLDRNPSINQRELSKELGVSLGKVNYCIQALKDKGLVKARSFKNSQNKRGYLYVLTPQGIDEKAKITVRFLNRKLSEYEELKQEIARLKNEIN